MRAAVLSSTKHLEIDPHYPEPPLGPADVKLKVNFTGICGSDLHCFVMGEQMTRIPSVMGHEFCAEVMELGSEAQGFKICDRAAGLIYPSCGTCDYCLDGDYTLCDNLGRKMFERNGSFAEYISVPARQLVKIAPHIPTDEAALIEPLSVAVHAVRRAALNIGDVVVVMGGGPLGLLITQLVKLSGAAKVILVEPAPSRQQLGYKFGADAAIYPDEHLREQVSDLTGRRRVDAVFEVSGNPRAFDAASRLVGKLGRLILVAVYEEKRVEFNPNRFLNSEIDLIACFWSRRIDFRCAADLIASRQIDVRPLITGKIALEQMQQAFEMLVADRSSHSKVLVACS
jgi:(R,R)-butanediol dehydrogenase / meso-butanediol dehydrogenase / diacetyl reductase